MSMLKHVLTFFAFIMVSLAPMSADEGYIPFFPDFLEPDGIAIRDKSKATQDILMTNIKPEYRIRRYFPPRIVNDFENSQDKIYISSEKTGAQGNLLNYFTFEYRKNYFYKKLFFTGKILELNNFQEKNILATSISNSTGGENPYVYNPYLTKPLRINNSSNFNDKSFDNYRSLLSYKEFNLLKNNTDESWERTLNFDITSKYSIFGYGVGIDLWILELAYGPFFMLYESNIRMKSCSYEGLNRIYNDDDFYYRLGKFCDSNKNKNIYLDEKSFQGYSYGLYFFVSGVLLETENWKLTFAKSNHFTNFGLYDYSGRKINFRGLNIYPNIMMRSGTGMGDSTGFQIIYYFR